MEQSKNLFFFKKKRRAGVIYGNDGRKGPGKNLWFGFWSMFLSAPIRFGVLYPKIKDASRFTIQNIFFIETNQAEPAQ